MLKTLLKLSLLGILLVVGSAILTDSAPVAQEQRYVYGMFKINGYAFQDPTRGFCGPQCKVPNRELNSTYIHSPIFRLPERNESIDLWETGKEFCRRARRQMGEGWWAKKGMPDCIDGALSQFYTQENATEELQKLYGRAQRETRPDHLFEVFEFADFQPKNVKLLVLRFPGSVPAPMRQGAGSEQTRSPAEQPTEPRFVAPATPRSGIPPSAQPQSLPVTSAQELAEIAAREKLNSEQAAVAARQNDATKAAFDQATADRAATIARQEGEHQAAVAAVEAERVRREREYAAQMAKWRADVAACKAGDKSRCAPQ